MAAKRASRRRSKSSSGSGGMARWYAVGLVALAGIVGYDHRDELMARAGDVVAAIPKSHAAPPARQAPNREAAARDSDSREASSRVKAPAVRESAAATVIPAVRGEPVPPVAIPVAVTRASAVSADVNARVGRFGLCGETSQADCVIDGQTFLSAGLKVRIADIDAPAIHPARCGEEQRLGNAARLRLQSLLNAGTFVLSPSGRDEDPSGNKLRIVMRAGQSIGSQLVHEGLARRPEGNDKPWCS